MVARDTGFGKARPVVVRPKATTLRKFSVHAKVNKASTGRNVGQLGNAPLGTSAGGGSGSGGMANASKPPVLRPGGAGLLGTKGSRGNLASGQKTKPVVVHAATTTPKAGTSQEKY